MENEEPSDVLNSTANKTKQRVGVGMPAFLKLQEFGSQLWFAFGDTPYQVGSSLTGTTWRDVDLRVLLDDAQWDAMELGDPHQCHYNGKWVALCRAFSALGKEMTGLPIDFQLQKRSQANDEFGGDKHPRSACGFVPLRFAHRGDTTTKPEAGG